MARTSLPLLVAIVLMHAVPKVAAQDTPDRTVEINHFEYGVDDPDTRVTRSVREALEYEFRLNGIEAADSYVSQLVLSARSVVTPAGDHIMVAIVEGSGLTEPILDAAAENEIWYADKPRPENLEEGSFVRQYMTRETFGDLLRVHGVRLLFFPEQDLQMEISLYVADYRDRMSCEECDGGE